MLENDARYEEVAEKTRRAAGKTEETAIKRFTVTPWSGEVKPEAQVGATCDIVPRQESFAAAAVATFFLALIFRIFHLWQIRRAPFFSVLMGDSRGYDLWAQRIAGGDWLGTDVFYQAPLYPYFLGTIYVAGRTRPRGRPHGAGDDRIGLSACFWAWPRTDCGRGRRVLPPASMLALYAPAIFFDGLIQKTVLDVFFVCFSLWLMSGVLAADSHDAPPPLKIWLWLGLAMGGLALTRENAMVFVVVLLAWIVVRRAGGSLPPACDRCRHVLARPGPRARPRGCAQQRGQRRFLHHDRTVRAEFLPRKQPHRRRHCPVASSRPRLGRCERQDATELAEHAMGRRLTPAEVSQSLDRSRVRLHHLAARRLAEADGAQVRAPLECHRNARHREPGKLRRMVRTVALRLDRRPLRRARAARMPGRRRDLA